MRRFMFRLFPALHAFLYRLTRGAFGSRMRGFRVLLLTTTGRKTGKSRTTPLGYFEDGGGYVIVGSNGGQYAHPAWFLNLRNNPRVLLQVNDDRFPADAAIASSSERTRLWARLMEVAPAYGQYEKSTTREIPLVVLRRVHA